MGDLKAAVETVLEQFWAEESLDLGEATTGEIDALVAAMDSLTATDVLARLQDLVGMELPTGELIRRGGYDTKEQFMNELTHKVLDYVAEHRQ